MVSSRCISNACSCFVRRQSPVIARCTRSTFTLLIFSYDSWNSSAVFKFSNFIVWLSMWLCRLICTSDTIFFPSCWLHLLIRVIWSFFNTWTNNLCNYFVVFFSLPFLLFLSSQHLSIQQMNNHFLSGVCYHMQSNWLISTVWVNSSIIWTVAVFERYVCDTLSNN